MQAIVAVTVVLVSLVLRIIHTDNSPIYLTHLTWLTFLAGALLTLRYLSIHHRSRYAWAMPVALVSLLAAFLAVGWVAS